MPKEVPPSGPADAQIAVFGEAPGRDEDREGRPFVGMAGRELEDWFTSAGLQREEIRVDNVLRVRPPNDKLDALEFKTLAHAASDVQERIMGLATANVIIAAGAYAFNAIRYGAEGIKQTKKGLKFRDSITKWRGSEIPVEIGGRTRKLIPLIHPAAIMQTPSWRQRCLVDMARVARESHTPEVYLQPWVHETTPSLGDVEAWVAELYDNPPEALTFDIETPNRIFSCIGFARSDRPTVSYTIPTHISYWKNPQVLARVWTQVGRLVRSPGAKVTQNGLFDTYWLKRLCGFEPTNWVWDLMGMHHTLNPFEEHSLAFMSSVFAPHYCFWKDEAKDEESLKKYKGTLEAIYTYNGMDCCRQIELWPLLLGALKGVTV